MVKVIRGHGVGFDMKEVIFSVSPNASGDTEELGNVLPVFVHRMDDAVYKSPEGMRAILRLVENTTVKPANIVLTIL